MITNRAIKELAGAMKLLAWHVGNTATNQEAKAELKGIEDAMARIQNEHDDSEEVEQ
jgi:hypothetical protein